VRAVVAVGVAVGAANVVACCWLILAALAARPDEGPFEGPPEAPVPVPADGWGLAA